MVIGFRTLALTAAIALAAQVSYAQRGMGGGFGGGGNQGNLTTLAMAEVQKELDLNDEQKEKIKKLAADVQTETRAQFQGMQGLSAEERTKKMEEARAKMQTRGEEITKEVEAILTPAQRVRIKQVAIQIQGSRALDQKEIQEALGITDAQKEQLTKIRTESRGQFGRGTGGAPGAPGAARPNFAEIQKQTEEKVMAVLTDEQKAKLETMKGKAFDTTALRARGPGAGAGNRRPGGNTPPANPADPQTKEL